MENSLKEQSIPVGSKTLKPMHVDKSAALFGLKDHMHDPAIEEALTNPVRRSRLTSHE